jgi:hypothetical protein
MVSRNIVVRLEYYKQCFDVCNDDFGHFVLRYLFQQEALDMGGLVHSDDYSMYVYKTRVVHYGCASRYHDTIYRFSSKQKEMACGFIFNRYRIDRFYRHFFH